MENISINPTEQLNNPQIRSEIVLRDKYCMFPIIRDGLFVGLEVTLPSKYGEVHHITPRAFLRKHRPQTELHHPFNLITLSVDRHSKIHTEWISRYPNEMEKRIEILSHGKAGWLDIYDDYFTSMAIVNSFHHVTNELDLSPYYREYADEIIEMYKSLDGNFIDRYEYLRDKWLRG